MKYKRHWSHANGGKNSVFSSWTLEIAFTKFFAVFVAIGLDKHPWVRDYCSTFRSSPLEVFLGKSVLKICSKFTGEHPCRSVISIKLGKKPLQLY